MGNTDEANNTTEAKWIKITENNCDAVSSE